MKGDREEKNKQMREVKQNTIKERQEKRQTERQRQKDRKRETQKKRDRKRKAHTFTRSAQTLTHYYKRTFLFTLRYSIPFMIKKKKKRINKSGVKWVGRLPAGMFAINIQLSL